MKKIDQVKEFHKLMNQPILDKPTIPDIDRCNLRVELISEELKELEDAIKANDLVGILDALADIRFVLDGAVLEFGVQHVFDDAFNDVYESNMSKECESHEVALKTSQYYEIERGVLTRIEPTTNGKYKVVRLMDNKALKSINYKAVDLTKYVK